MNFTIELCQISHDMRCSFTSANLLRFSSSRSPKLTHYAFRYPAKFHIPVVRELIERYTSVRSICLDPFNGSGTLIVEALASNRNAIGLDVDPVAVFVSRAKTMRIPPERLQAYSLGFAKKVRNKLSKDTTLQRRLQTDIARSTYEKRLSTEGLTPPPIPNLDHWFRRSVIVQLTRIKTILLKMDVEKDIRDFLLLCFASIIRPCSNADPTPVSGLEVTSHMRKKEESGRTIDVEKELLKAIERCMTGAIEFYKVASSRVAVTNAFHDARQLAGSPYAADAVITSPPYHSAVDYYRRHQLEMYWLDLIGCQQERIDLIPSYLGRSHIAKKYLPTTTSKPGKIGKYWFERIRAINEQRANAFHHYYQGMHDFFSGVSSLLPQGAPLVLVVGNNKVHGEEFPTVQLFNELSKDYFVLHERFWYPVKNRYMSYDRHNGASIDREYVLVWRRS